MFPPGTSLGHEFVKASWSDPDFSILAACYPYLARLLLTDDNPRTQRAHREMLYGTSGASRIDSTGQSDPAPAKPQAPSVDALCRTPFSNRRKQTAPDHPLPPPQVAHMLAHELCVCVCAGGNGNEVKYQGGKAPADGLWESGCARLFVK
jgi:hypothetical protein